ncbi:MAG: hypothetical protein AAB381_02335 [Patescibacteria group bacterium]
MQTATILGKVSAVKILRNSALKNINTKGRMHRDWRKYPRKAIVLGVSAFEVFRIFCRESSAIAREITENKLNANQDMAYIVAWNLIVDSHIVFIFEPNTLK